MKQSEIDLETEDLQVLNAIQQSNRPPTSVTLKEQLYWADGDKIRYRLQKLSNRELIEKWQSSDRGDDHKWPVTVAKLTTAGENIADEYEDEPEAQPLEQRVKEAEKKLSAMGETYLEFKQRIVDLEDEVEDHDDDLEELAEEVRHVQQFLESEGGAE